MLSLSIFRWILCTAKEAIKASCKDSRLVPGHDKELQALMFCPKNGYNETTNDNKNKLYQQIQGCAWGLEHLIIAGRWQRMTVTGPHSVFTQTRLHSIEQLIKPVKSRVGEWQVTWGTISMPNMSATKPRAKYEPWSLRKTKQVWDRKAELHSLPREPRLWTPGESCNLSIIYSNVCFD